MKTYCFVRSGLVLILSLMIGMNTYSQESKGAILKLEKERHDYGLLYTDSLPEGKLNIAFVNDGEEPLILSQVTACCGTRVKDWPRNPILPGETEIVQVEFRLAQRPHRLNRVVTITSNCQNNSTTRFRILGQIEER